MLLVMMFYSGLSLWVCIAMFLSIFFQLMKFTLCVCVWCLAILNRGAMDI